MAKKRICILTTVTLLALFAAVGLWVNLQQTAQAYPKPAFVPPRDAWQLDFVIHGNPQAIWVTLPGDISPTKFWYITYSVTNNTAEDIEFYPQFDLMTDTMLLSHAGVGVRRPVFEAIRKRYRTSLPLLEHESMISGKILQGDDNSRDSVAIFSDFDPNAVAVSLFVSGLSNETVSITHPTEIDAKTQKPKDVLLRKTLRLKYQVVGDPLVPENRAILYRDRDWIMR